jgi:hypothetical protein
MEARETHDHVTLKARMSVETWRKKLMKETERAKATHAKYAGHCVAIVFTHMHLYAHNPTDEMIGKQMIAAYLVVPRYRDLAWQAFKDSYEAARQ